MQTLPDPASAAEAMDQVLSGLSYLAAADPTALAAQAQAECLQAFEQADAMSTAARARILARVHRRPGLLADAVTARRPRGLTDPTSSEPALRLQETQITKCGCNANFQTGS